MRFIMNAGRTSKQGQQINVGKDTDEYNAIVNTLTLHPEDLKALVLDHPLRGLDPGAAETVNRQIRAVCDRGTAVLLLADTLEEALHMGDEILVMRDGEVTARFDLAVEAPTAIDLLEKMV